MSWVLLGGGFVAQAFAACQAERKPVTDELQRIARLGWNSDAVESAFAGQD